LCLSYKELATYFNQELELFNRLAATSLAYQIWGQVDLAETDENERGNENENENENGKDRQN
jgi:hypothetical protein